MTNADEQYRLKLSLAAQRDLSKVLQWSLRKFGSAAATRYAALLGRGFRDLEADPFRPGSRSYPALASSVRTYHLSASRERAPEQVKRPRHLILYRVGAGRIDVARILYDRSDFERHLPASDRM